MPPKMTKDKQTESKSHPVFTIGDMVWAKLKGYPYWPAIIANPPAHVQVPKFPENNQCVYFLGTKDYGFVAMDCICDYKTNEEKFKSSSKLKQFVIAIKEMEAILNNNNEPPKVSSLEKSKMPLKPNKRKLYKNGKEMKNNNKLNKKSQYDTNVIKRKKQYEVGMKTDNHSSSGKSDSESEELNLTSETYDKYAQHLIRCTFMLRSRDNVASCSSIGFIGLNRRGGIILKSLLKSGHCMTIWAEKKESCIPFKNKRASVASSITRLILDTQLLILSYDDQNQVSNFIENHRETLELLKRRVVNFGLIPEETSLWLSGKLEAIGCRYLDVRLLGTEEDAVSGTCFALIAGNHLLYKDIETCLKALNKQYLYEGEDISSMLEQFSSRCAVEGSISPCKKQSQ